jgi:hypothetical protein
VSQPAGTLQQRVEALEKDRQKKAKRVAGHSLFSQQLPVAPDPAQQGQSAAAPQTDHQQVIMDAVLKALSGHYAQQAVVHAKKGGSLGKVLAVAKKKATVKPAVKPVKKTPAGG